MDRLVEEAKQKESKSGKREVEEGRRGVEKKNLL